MKSAHYELFKVRYSGEEGRIDPFIHLTEDEFQRQLEALKHHSVPTDTCLVSDFECDHPACEECFIRMFDAIVSNPNITKLYMARPYTLRQYLYICERLKENNSVTKIHLFGDHHSVDDTLNPERILDALADMLQTNTTLKRLELYYDDNSPYESKIEFVESLLKRNRTLV